jgi:NAD(P)-dependent dehydrogenase (short-subunit alcohol dehydrogenase family)
MDSFAGKTILITGASEGIGRALALELAADRPNLVLAARTPERLEATAAQCRERGAGVLALPTDVGDEASCRAFVARAAASHGRIDALVNNAGITMWARFDAVSDLDAFRHLMQVNYLGAVMYTAPR